MMALLKLAKRRAAKGLLPLGWFIS